MTNGIIMSSIEREKTDWLWNRRVPNAFMSLLMGRQSVGKSSFRDDLIARITMGRAFPDGTPNPTARNVILVTPEEDVPGVVLDRLTTLGADTNRILLLNKVRRTAKDTGMKSEGKFKLPGDLELLKEEIYALKNVALVVLDPIMAILETKYAKSGNQMIREHVVDPFQEMLADMGIAGLVVCHYTKSNSPDWNVRLGGSAAWGDVTRSAIEVSVNNTNSSQRLLTWKKYSNTENEPSQMVYERLGDGRLDFLTGLTTQESEVQQALHYTKAGDSIHALLLSDPMREFTPQEVAQETMIPAPNVRQHLRAMLSKGQVEQTAYGLYRMTSMIAVP